MVRALQINLDGGDTADGLLQQAVREKNIDLVFIGEQYTNRPIPDWYKDTLGRAAIWVTDAQKIRVEEHGAGEGFVWIKSAGVTYISVYLSPNGGIELFQARLNGLEDFTRDLGSKVLMAGDFNAKAVEWGEPEPDSRGRRLMEMAARLDMVVLNEGTITTFRRPGYRQTIIDITLASESLAPEVEKWKVLEDFTGSFHQYVKFEIGETTNRNKKATQPNKRWNVTRMDAKIFRDYIKEGQAEIANLIKDADARGDAETVVQTTMRIIEKACQASMPLKTTRKGKRPMYWWTEEIATLRNNCLKMRRKATRANRNARETTTWAEQYKEAKKALKKAIWISKKEKWISLSKEIDNDPWGKAYQILMGKFTRPNANQGHSAQEMEEIVDVLFPAHPKRADDPPLQVNETPLFSAEELARATGSMKNGKAPGPDGVPAEALKEAVRASPQLMLNMYNSCLKAGIFSQRWKRQKLVLIDKGKGGPRTASSYRPLCMLDTAGKLMEKLLRGRLNDAITEAGGLAQRQYGFRPGRSTVDAVRDVVATVQEAWKGNQRSKNLALLVTLDVKNAFNSLRWVDVLQALENRFNIPAYLLRVIRNYLKQRTLIYDTVEGPRSREVTAGAAQGSILGSDLWNVSYDGILRIELPWGVIIVGYADDIAIVIIARNIEQAQLVLSIVIGRIWDWLREHGLDLAIPKSELLLLTRRRIDTIVPMSLGEFEITTKDAIRHLGIILDTKLTYSQHIIHAADKAAKVVAALSRAMANTNGPSPSKRRLLMSVAHSIMLYGAEVWADALNTECYRKRLAAVQRRSALRVACAYRTVSEPAVLLIAGIIPIDLLAKKRKRVYERKGEEDRTRVKIEEHENVLLAWERQLKEEPRGEWTRRLISNAKAWMNKAHGEVNYYLTQFLSGHGCFRSYLYKMKRAPDPKCRYCNAEEDDAYHTFFVCPRWNVERAALRSEIGSYSPDTVIEKMVKSQQTWNTVAAFTKAVLRKKREEAEIFDAEEADENVA